MKLYKDPVFLYNSATMTTVVSSLRLKTVSQTQSLYNTAVVSLVFLGFLWRGWRFLLSALRSSLVQNVLEDVFALTLW